MKTPLSFISRKKNKKQVSVQELKRSAPRGEKYFDEEMLSKVVCESFKFILEQDSCPIYKTPRHNYIDFFQRIYDRVELYRHHVVNTGSEKVIITEEFLKYFTNSVISLLESANVSPYYFVETVLKDNIVLTHNDIALYTQNIQDVSQWPDAFYSFQFLMSNQYPQIDTYEKMLNSVYHIMRDGLIFHSFSHVGTFLEKYTQTKEGRDFVINSHKMPPETFLRELFKRMNGSMCVGIFDFKLNTVGNDNQLFLAQSMRISENPGGSSVVFNFGDGHGKFYFFQSNAKTPIFKRHSIDMEKMVWPYLLGRYLDDAVKNNKYYKKNPVKIIFGKTPAQKTFSRFIKFDALHSVIFSKSCEQNDNILSKIKKMLSNRYSKTILTSFEERQELEKPDTLFEKYAQKYENPFSLQNFDGLFQKKPEVDNVTVEVQGVHYLDCKAPFEHALEKIHNQPVELFLQQVSHLSSFDNFIVDEEKKIVSSSEIDIFYKIQSKRTIDINNKIDTRYSEFMDSCFLERFIVEHFVLSDEFSMIKNYKRLIEYKNTNLSKGISNYLIKQLFTLNDGKIKLSYTIEALGIDTNKSRDEIVRNLYFTLKHSLTGREEEFMFLKTTLNKIELNGLDEYEKWLRYKNLHLGQIIERYKHAPDDEKNALIFLRLWLGRLISYNELIEYFSCSKEVEELIGHMKDIFEDAKET